MPDKDFIVFDDIDKYGSETYERSYELAAGELDRIDLAAIGPVALVATASKGDLPGEYLVDGSTSFTGDLTCSRCVEPFPFANSSEFHLRFRPRSVVLGESEVEITPDELDIEFYTERLIPLRDLAAEQVQLSIPMKPLCTESCLGLCPQCGTNRNLDACTCQSSVSDERWGALAGIRAELAKKSEQ
jgi:uncharacterized metal-binding protein YceD (DUF177 family)